MILDLKSRLGEPDLSHCNPDLANRNGDTGPWSVEVIFVIFYENIINLIFIHIETYFMIYYSDDG